MGRLVNAPTDYLRSACVSGCDPIQYELNRESREQYPEQSGKHGISSVAQCFTIGTARAKQITQVRHTSRMTTTSLDVVPAALDNNSVVAIALGPAISGIANGKTAISKTRSAGAPSTPRGPAVRAE